MTQTLLQVRTLTKCYGDTKVVDDVSFDISPGECLGVIGPNGAGKTTTIRICLGLTVPDGGSVTFYPGGMVSAATSSGSLKCRSMRWPSRRSWAW